jgi:hypothetical protein
MPYKERTREFWLAVTNGKCAYEFYTEKRGWQTCNAKASHIHHIEGERDQLYRGDDPEHSVALPLCQNHHVRNIGEVLGEFDSSFHPDMGHAYQSYKEWKQNAEHMKAISGKSIDYSTSPFADAAKGHKQALQNGERYINGDERTDEYYIEKMTAMAVLYLARHPELTKPTTKPHPLYDSSKKKHWWNHD